MRQWVILSGKGGTGKTSVAAALAHLAAQECRLVLADADIDAANLELVLAPRVLETHDFSGAKRAEIEADSCTGCGLCAETCRFDAVGAADGVYRIEPTACEGCAACFYRCPTQAIRMVDQVSGQWFRSDTRFGPLFHARLFAGQENSGKLVTQVKQSARHLAAGNGADLLLVDGPPGIGCPVIATTTGADLALLVVEPTVSGVHDLQRILAATRHFRVPAAVCVNKADINPAQTAKVAAYCAQEDVPMVGAIPFDTVVTDAMVHRQPVTEYHPGPVADALQAIWRDLRRRLDGADGGER